MNAPALLHHALRCLDTLEALGGPPRWTLGGGVALALAWEHRTTSVTPSTGTSVFVRWRALPLLILAAACSSGTERITGLSGAPDIDQPADLAALPGPSATDVSPEIADAVNQQVADAEPDVSDVDQVGTRGPCAAPKGAGCGEGGAPGPVTGATAMTVFDGGALCSFEVDEGPPCQAGVCHLGACVGAADEVPHDLAVQVASSLRVADPECCFDVDGAGSPDNAFGANLDFAWTQFGNGAFDDTVRSSIERGYYVVAVAFDPAQNPARLWLVRADPSPPTSVFPLPSDTVLMGRPSSYVPSTRVPLSSAALTETGPDSWASDGPIETFILPIANGGVSINLVGRNVRIGLHRVGGGYELEIGGYVLKSDLVNAVNDYFSEQCACWTLKGPPLALSIDPASVGDLDVNPDLTLDSAPDCPKVGCAEFALLMLSDASNELVRADIDSNGDGVDDAISFGVVFATSPVADLLAPALR